MIRQAYFHRKGTYCYFFPTTRLGRRILWDGSNKDGKNFLSYIPPQILESANSVEMKITLSNGSVIQIVGTDHIENVGINPVGCVFSEYSLQSPNAWTFTRPILRENGGWAVFNFTPRGKNHAYDLYQMAKHNEEWYCSKLSVEDTGILSARDIEKEREEGMSEDKIQQEYFCNFDRGVEGAYYAQLLNAAEKDGRIGNVPYDPSVPVDTHWDLGVDDSTAIIFHQSCGNEIHIIDTYEAHGEGLQHYARVLKQKAEENCWVYGAHYGPHDLRVRELGSGARSRLEIARDLGINFEIVPNIQISDGIEHGRNLWPRLWIDRKKCLRFIKAAENYHRQYNEKLNVYSERPLHDWSSHCFTGDTLIWTRSGMQRIMDLPQTGEVMTLNGWSHYECPRITRRNAKLVEVKFQDGTKVKCTPDHLFLTKSGWKSAESLIRGTKIQSCSSPEYNTFNKGCTSFGQMKTTILEAAKSCIEPFGSRLLDQFQKGVTFIIEMVTLSTTDSATLSAWTPQSTCKRTQSTASIIPVSQKLDSKKQKNGIALKLGDDGIQNMQNAQKVGQSGNVSRDNVWYAIKHSIVSFVKAATSRSSVTQTAKPLIIDGVKELKQADDVWCLTVPETEHFSLQNGAVVHNCMDAYRYLAITMNRRRNVGRMSEEDANALESAYYRRK